MASVDVLGMEKTDVSGSSLYCLPRRSPIQENLPHSGQSDTWCPLPPTSAFMCLKNLTWEQKCESVSPSVVSNSAIPWTVAPQASLSMEFSRQILEWVAIPFSRGSFWKYNIWLPAIPYPPLINQLSFYVNFICNSKKYPTFRIKRNI